MFSILKKVLLVLVFVSFAQAAQDEDSFQKVSISSVVTTALPRLSQPPLIVFNYAGSGKTNCITDVSFSANNFPAAGVDFYILESQQGATMYAITTSTGPFVESWYPKNPLCLSYGATTYVYFSTGNYKVNINGYVK